MSHVGPGRAKGFFRGLAYATQICGLFAATSFSPAFAADSIVAVDARVEEGKGTSSLIFYLSHPAQASAFVLADPQRVVVDLPEINFQTDPVASKPLPARKVGSQGRGALRHPDNAAAASLIKAYRFGLLGPGRSRIVIDLSNPARIVRATSERIGQGEASKLVIELAGTDLASFRAAADTASSAEAAIRDNSVPLPVKTAGDSALPLIVVDPGHGGIDAGASSAAGAIEKSIVFDFAKVLAAKLESGGHYRVLLTRRDDSFVSLGERVQVARNNHAALFLSIHADTLAATQEVQGATIYTLAETASDAEAAKVAEKENQADAQAGVVAREEAGELNDILFDLTRRETRAYSHLFARTLVGVWQSAGRLNKNPQREAGFKVLRAPDVPSVLIELGYLSSTNDVAELISPQWRDKAAETIALSVGRFFNSRSAEEARANAPIAPASALAGSVLP